MAKIDDEIAALQAEVARDTTVMGSATTLINGIQARVDAAVAAATAAGATPEQLAEIQAVSDSLKTSADDLATAVTANTLKAGTPAA
jgi:hypothetical protein